MTSKKAARQREIDERNAELVQDAVKMVRATWLQAPRHSLLLILMDKEGYFTFYDFLKSEYATENLEFWTRMELLFTGRTRKEVLETGVSVLMGFDNDSINIQDSLRNEVVSVLSHMAQENSHDDKRRSSSAAVSRHNSIDEFTSDMKLHGQDTEAMSSEGEGHKPAGVEELAREALGGMQSVAAANCDDLPCHDMPDGLYQSWSAAVDDAPPSPTPSPLFANQFRNSFTRRSFRKGALASADSAAERTRSHSPANALGRRNTIGATEKDTTPSHESHGTLSSLKSKIIRVVNSPIARGRSQLERSQSVRLKKGLDKKESQSPQTHSQTHSPSHSTSNSPSSSKNDSKSTHQQATHIRTRRPSVPNLFHNRMHGKEKTNRYSGASDPYTAQTSKGVGRAKSDGDMFQSRSGNSPTTKKKSKGKRRLMGLFLSRNNSVDNSSGHSREDSNCNAEVSNVSVAASNRSGSLRHVHSLSSLGGRNTRQTYRDNDGESHSTMRRNTPDFQSSPLVGRARRHTNQDIVSSYTVGKRKPGLDSKNSRTPEMHGSRRNSPANRDSSNTPPHHETNGYTTHRDRPMSMQLGAPVGHTYHADGPSNQKSWRSIASRTISVDAAHFNFDEPPIHTAPIQSPSSELSLNAVNDSAGVQSKKRGTVENKSTDPKARAGSSATTPSRTATPTNAKLYGTTSDVQSNATDMFGEPIIGAEIGGGLSDVLGMGSTGSLPVQKGIVTKRGSNASDDYKLGPPDNQKPLAAKSWRDLAKLNFNKKHYTFDQPANGTDSSGHNSPDSVSSARGSFEFGLNAITKTVKTGIASPREDTHTATTYAKKTRPTSFSASESEADRSSVQFVNSIGAKAKTKTKTNTKTQTQAQNRNQNQNQNQGPGLLSNPNTSDEDNSSQAYNKRTRALKSKLLTIQSVGSALERGIDATEDERRVGESPQSPTLLSTVTSEDSFSANVLGSAHPEEIHIELQRINEAAMRVREAELLRRAQTQAQTQTQTQPGGGLHFQTSGGLHTQAGIGTSVDGNGNGNGNGNGTVEKDQESSERSESKESLRAQQHAVVTRSPSYAHTHARPHSQSKALDIRMYDNGGEASARMHEVLYGHRNGTNSAQKKTHEDMDTGTKAKAKVTVRRRDPGRTTAERPKSASYSCLHVPSNGPNGNGSTPKIGHHARSLASPHSLTDLLSPRPITPRAKTSMTYAAAGMFVNDAATSVDRELRMTTSMSAALSLYRRGLTSKELHNNREQFMMGSGSLDQFATADVFAMTQAESNTLQKAQRQVLSLMALDSFPRFLNSPQGVKYMTSLATKPPRELDYHFKNAVDKYHTDLGVVNKETCSYMSWFSITISLANMLPYCVTIATMASLETPLAFVNFNFVSQTKYSVKESLGKNCRFLQGPETKPEHRARFREALENGEACISDITNYKKDGQQFPCRLHLQPVYGKQQQSKPVFYIGLQTDMSNATLVNGNNVVLEPLLEFLAANNNSNT